MTGAGGLDTQGQYTQTNTLSCTQRRDTRTCIHTCRSGQATASPKHLENNFLNLGNVSDTFQIREISGESELQGLEKPRDPRLPPESSSFPRVSRMPHASI